MRFNVTPKDIREGIADNCIKCPVARSLARRFPNQGIYVSPYTIAIGDTYYLMPGIVKRFIEKFDNNEPVKPFSFLIDLK